MRKIRSDSKRSYDNTNEKHYLHHYPNRLDVTGRAAISGALSRQISQRGYFCSACEGLTDPETHQSSTFPSFLHPLTLMAVSVECGVTLQTDAHSQLMIEFIHDDSV